MELQSTRSCTPRWVRHLYIDLRNLLANPIAFTLPTILILLVNLAYLNAVITSANQSDHLLPISTFLLLSAFLSSLLSIPFEIREGYSDRIQIEFGSIARRLIARLLSNALIGAVLTLVPFLILVAQSRFSHLTLDFQFKKFALLALATIYMTTLGTLIGALWRNYLALSLLGAAILILQVSHGFIDDSSWAFSTLVERLLMLEPETQLRKIYSTSILAFMQMSIVITSPLGNWLNRSRSRPKSLKGVVVRESRFTRTTFRLGNGYFALMLKQITSISAHMKMVPFTIFLFAVYPIISAEEIFSELRMGLRVPIVSSMLITSLFSCLISIGAYKLSEEERERDALAFGGIKRYQRYMDIGYSAIFTFIGVFIYVAYFSSSGEISEEITSALFLRPLALVLVTVPIFSLLARKITNLKIDVRFFILFSIAIPIGEMILAGVMPGISRFLPSSILAALAGGKGLYVLIGSV